MWKAIHLGILKVPPQWLSARGVGWGSLQKWWRWRHWSCFLQTTVNMACSGISIISCTLKVLAYIGRQKTATVSHMTTTLLNITASWWQFSLKPAFWCDIPRNRRKWKECRKECRKDLTIIESLPLSMEIVSKYLPLLSCPLCISCILLLKQWASQPYQTISLLTNHTWLLQSSSHKYTMPNSLGLIWISSPQLDFFALFKKNTLNIGMLAHFKILITDLDCSSSQMLTENGLNRWKKAASSPLFLALSLSI